MVQVRDVFVQHKRYRPEAPSIWYTLFFLSQSPVPQSNFGTHYRQVICYGTDFLGLTARDTHARVVGGTIAYTCLAGDLSCAD